MIRERDVPLEGRRPAEFWRRRPETALAIAVGAMAVAGLVLRLVELAERPLHHDESIDAWYSWKFLEGTFEGYDPVYHGPLRFYLTAAIFWVFGESHTTARMVAVLAGVGLIVLPWFLRRSLGPAVTLVASAVLAFSPIALYMTRLGREDSLTAFITLAMMVVIVRLLDRPRLLLPALFGFLLAAGFAVKETTFIVVFIFGGFFMALLAEQAAQRNSEGRADRPGRFAGWSWMLPAGLVPMGIAFGVSAYYEAEVFVTLGVYGVLMAMVILMQASPAQIWDLPVVRAARGVPGWGWALAAAVFLFFFALWFTVFFTNSAGFLDGFTEGITYWRGEQDTNRGSEPWHYYLYTIGLYEYLVCILVVIGTVHVFRHPTFVGKFMVWTAVASWFSYSWASERFPWLALHILVPMAFLAGYGVQVLWRARRKDWMISPIWVVLAALLASTLFVSWRSNYVNQRDPRELLTQVHTTDDYLDTVRRIEALNDYSLSVGEGPVTVAVDTAISVPNLWYFRDYEGRQWTDTASAQHASADFVLALPESGIAGAAPDMANHHTTRMPLRDWWAPQFESYHDGLFSGWAQWLVDREVWNEGTLGSTDFDLSVSPRALDLEARMGAG